MTPVEDRVCCGDSALNRQQRHTDDSGEPAMDMVARRGLGTCSQVDREQGHHRLSGVAATRL